MHSLPFMHACLTLCKMHLMTERACVLVCVHVCIVMSVEFACRQSLMFGVFQRGASMHRVYVHMCVCGYLYVSCDRCMRNAIYFLCGESCVACYQTSEITYLGMYALLVHTRKKKCCGSKLLAPRAINHLYSTCGCAVHPWTHRSFTNHVAHIKHLEE